MIGPPAPGSGQVVGFGSAKIHSAIIHCWQFERNERLLEFMLKSERLRTGCREEVWVELKDQRMRRSRGQEVFTSDTLLCFHRARIQTDTSRAA